MTADCELTIRGVYFKNDLGKWVESYAGTPGVELVIGDVHVFIDYRETSLLARTVNRLGTSGDNSVTVRAHRRHPATGDQVETVTKQRK